MATQEDAAIVERIDSLVAEEHHLEREHSAMCAAISKALRKPCDAKFLRQLYGVAFHDVYHAGQIRLLRRLQER